MAGGMSRGAPLPNDAKPPHTFTPKHCWVPQPSQDNRSLARSAARMARKRRRLGGRVAYVPHLQNGHALVELWLPAQLLHAVPQSRPLKYRASGVVSRIAHR
jgi:hypothetical protein